MAAVCLQFLFFLSVAWVRGDGGRFQGFGRLQQVWASFQKPPNFAAAGAVYIYGEIRIEGGLLDIHNATAGRQGGLRRGTSPAGRVRCEGAVKERTAEDRTGDAGAGD